MKFILPRYIFSDQFYIVISIISIIAFVLKTIKYIIIGKCEDINLISSAIKFSILHRFSYFSREWQFFDQFLLWSLLHEILILNEWFVLCASIFLWIILGLIFVKWIQSLHIVFPIISINVCYYYFHIASFTVWTENNRSVFL